MSRNPYRRTLVRALPSILAAFALQLPAIPPAVADDGAEAFVFRNVHVISMDPDASRKVHKRRTVVVEDGVITAIGKASQVEVPDDAQVLDGRRKYLLPGLADMHAHGNDVPQLPADFDERDLHKLYLANGITTIFDPWGFPEVFRWARDIEQGRTVGPSIHFSSPGVNDRTHATADAVETSVRKWARKGYPWIKVHSDIAPEKFRRLHDVARELGLPVVGHALRPGFPIGDTLHEDQAMLSHIEEILSTSVTMSSPENHVAELAGPLEELVASRIWITGTVGTYQTIHRTIDDADFAELLARPEVRLLPPFVRNFWETQNPYRQPDFLQDAAHWERLLGVKLYIASRLAQLGGLDRLLLGTDSGVPLIVPGFAIHDELALLVEAGLSPWEALLTGTHNPAVFLGLEEEVGTIAVGKRADLLLVDKNPLRSVANLGRLSGVMVRGRWLPAEELEADLDELEDRFAE